MQEFVLIYARPVNSCLQHVLVVLKESPYFLAGRFNLIGGKIDPSETIEEAAIRELKEESGLEPAGKPLVMGVVYGEWGKAHCVKIPVFYADIHPGPNETETFAWLDWDQIRNCDLVLPTMKITVPMMYAGVMGFEIEDEGQPFGEPSHTMKITVKN